MPIIHWNTEQGSAEWFRLHSAIPTSSRFCDIMTPQQMKMSASRKKYACQLVASRLLNWQPSSLDMIKHIEEGRLKEPLAVGQLEIVREIETRKVGFVTTNDGKLGASPDRVVATGDRIDITIECKAPTIPTQFEYLLAERLAKMEPKSKEADVYKCQRQGHMLVAEADEAIFFSFHERTPYCYAQSYRDQPFIKQLEICLRQFDDELEELTDLAKSMGVYQAFPRLDTPLDAELGEEMRREGLPDLPDAINAAHRDAAHYRPASDAEIEAMISGDHSREIPPEYNFDE